MSRFRGAPTMHSEDVLGRASFWCTVLVFVSVSELSAQFGWTQYGGNPVMGFGPPGSWDRGTVISPTVIKTDSGYAMWYAATDTSQAYKQLEIGFAWSPDGTSWTRYAGNPVLPKRAGEWDDGGVGTPAVVQDGDTLRMWYTGSSSTGTIGPGPNPIGYATSLDGIQWTRRQAPVIQPGSTGEWDANIFLAGAVIKDDGLFKMWYVGGTGLFGPIAPISIGYASSLDGIIWTKYDNPSTTTAPYKYSDPILTHGSTNDWDANWAWCPTVLKTDTGYAMWYTGYKSGSYQVIMEATSTDGIQWNKSAQNPVMYPPNTWAITINFPSVIHYNDTLRMWFTGNTSSVSGGKIGYATAPIIIPSVQRLDINLPTDFALEQNYPNPFNPSTTIGFTLPHSAFVTLQIFNLLGEQIATLVSEDLPAGSYRREWNARDLPSGVYVYQLRAGGHAEMKKLVLVK